MELRQLRYFVAAAEALHMSRAAARLGLSQPALSQQIRDLEVGLGLSLFERLPRGLKLTEAGQDLLEQSRRILADVEHMTERLRHAAQGQIGRLRIAINEIAGQQRLVAQAFQAFRTAYPNVAIELSQLSTFEQLEALREGRIDAGFHHDQQQDLDLLDCVTLREDGFVLALERTHPLAARPRLAIADLADEPLVWLHRSINPLVIDQLLAALQARGVSPTIAIEARSDISMMNFISVGLGAGLVVSAERWGDRGEGAGANVVFRPLEDLSLPVNFVFASRRGDSSPLLANFTGIVRQAHAAALGNPDSPPAPPGLAPAITGATA